MIISIALITTTVYAIFISYRLFGQHVCIYSLLNTSLCFHISKCFEMSIQKCLFSKPIPCKLSLLQIKLHYKSKLRGMIGLVILDSTKYNFFLYTLQALKAMDLYLLRSPMC